MFHSFTEIQNFHNLRKSISNYPSLLDGSSKVTYKAKIKLHGNNAGIVVSDNGAMIEAQSRKKLITPTDDLEGFAKWVKANEDNIRAGLKDFYKDIPIPDLVFYGEWCGRGIQDKAAICLLDERIFVAFCMRLVNLSGFLGNFDFYSDPEFLSDLLSKCKSTHVLPWYKEITIDYSLTDEELAPVVAELNAIVNEVEECDPWVKENFNISSTGEGLVWYPMGQKSYKRFSNLVMKTKGAKHNTVVAKEPVQVSASAAASIEDFVKLTVSQARLDQGLNLLGGLKDKKLTGVFVKWICDDVQKECQAELEASNLTWAQVSKSVSDYARKFFFS